MVLVSAYKTKCDICLQVHREDQECPYRAEVEQYQKENLKSLPNFHPSQFYNRWIVYNERERPVYLRGRPGIGGTTIIRLPKCYLCEKSLVEDRYTRQSVYVLYVLYYIDLKWTYFFCTKRCAKMYSSRWLDEYPIEKICHYEPYGELPNQYFYKEINDLIKEDKKHIMIRFHQYNWQKTIPTFLDKFFGISKGAQKLNATY